MTNKGPTVTFGTYLKHTSNIGTTEKFKFEFVRLYFVSNGCQVHLRTMSDYSGEDLLKVFSELNISLLNVSPNVIKGWFDTDDKDLKRLLTWMCISLSKENYLSPLEYAE